MSNIVENQADYEYHKNLLDRLEEVEKERNGFKKLLNEIKSDTEDTEMAKMIEERMALI